MSTNTKQAAAAAKSGYSTKGLVLDAMFIALTYVFTAFVNVRLPIMANGGLIHLGNVPLFICAILLGKRTGMLAGAFGMGLFDLFKKNKQEEKATLDKGLETTKRSVFDKISHAIAGKSSIDDDVLDNLEEVLITSDVGVETTLKIIARIQARVARDKYVSTSELNLLLRDEIAQLLAETENKGSGETSAPASEGKCPYVILVVGVNGVGKTTTIGKLASMFKEAGKKVVLGAADTFRAAAVEQLCIWGERAGVAVIKQQMGSDPASVAYDTVASAKANNADVVIIDTAGRLQQGQPHERTEED